MISLAGAILGYDYFGKEYIQGLSFSSDWKLILFMFVLVLTVVPIVLGWVMSFVHNRT